MLGRKHRLKSITLLILGIILLGTAVACTKEDPEIKAYKDYLGGDRVYWYPYGDVPTSELEYDIKDINNDGVAELMIADYNVANGWGFYRLYTYHNSKMELVWRADNGSGPGEFYPTLKIYAADRSHQGVYETVYYSFSELPIRELYSALSYEKLDMDSEDGYEVIKEFHNEDGIAITEEQFEEGVNKLLGDAAGEKFEFKKVSK